MPSDECIFSNVCDFLKNFVVVLCVCDCANSQGVDSCCFHVITLVVNFSNEQCEFL